MPDTDYKSSLPVRTEADADERLQSKIIDYSTPTQGATVDTNGNLYVKDHGNDPSGANKILRLSQLGAPNPDGVYDGTNNTKPGSVGVIGHVRATTPGDSDLTQRITSKTGTTDTTVRALDVSMHDGNGNNISTSNPLPVKIYGATVGNDVLDFKATGPIAKDDDDTHTYTVTALYILTLQKICASASGKMKIEVFIGPAGSEARVLVLFNSTANPNVEYTFGIPQEIPAGENVLVKLTNKDNATMDMYSTIEGVENLA